MNAPQSCGIGQQVKYCRGRAALPAFSAVWRLQEGRATSPFVQVVDQLGIRKRFDGSALIIIACSRQPDAVVQGSGKMP